MDAAVRRDLGLLVVGVGFLGAQRAAAATLARGVELVAVTDLDPDAAARVADLHGAAAVPDLDAGLALERVDAVVIATPHADHAEQVRRALEAGKHVLCEKPLTIDPAEARALASLAHERWLRLATGFNHRYFPPVRDVVTLVNRGAIGRVEEVRARIGHRATPAFLVGWHADVARSGGGTLLDNGPHACDLVRRLLGEVTTVEARVSDRVGLPTGCETEAYARFRGRDGGFAELWSSWTQPDGYLTIEALGDRGHLRVETAPWRLEGRLGDGSTVRRRYLLQRLTGRFHRVWFRCDGSLVRELEAFARPPADPAGPEAPATGWDGCRATEMVQAAYESARTGRVVPLEPLPVRLPAEGRRGRRTASA